MVSKKYVNVITYVSKVGNIMPLMVVDEKGIKYKIDRIFRIENAASRAGGCGLWFQCSIKGKMRNLFYEVDRWFIESERGF